MKHKLIATSILAGAILSYSSNISADTPKFPDVPKWAEQSVNYLVDKQVLIGYPDGTFGSNDSLDRASATKIMTKVLGIQIDSDAKPSFTDSQNHWATPYIAAAEKAGIIKGEGYGIFNPYGKVTRAAMATMLVNAYKLQSTANHNNQSIFEDLKGHWGEKYANILIDLKISNGTDNGWQPNRFITRAEAAQLTAKTDMRNTGTKAPNATKTMYVDRPFITYHGPSLSSGITAKQHAPQVIEIIDQREDGWMLIATEQGNKWTPLNEKTETLNDIFTTYQEASHSSKALGTYEAQNVTIIEENGSWIRIRTNAGFQWVDKNQLNGSKEDNFLEGKTIIIDPGHGGIDSGNRGSYMDESKIVLDTSLRLQKLFEQKTPFNVLLTHNTDVRPGKNATDSLKKRVKFARENNGDIFVSIHGNGDKKGGRGRANGTETFYYQLEDDDTNPYVDESRILAEKIQKRLVKALETKNRGVKHGDLHVVRENSMPAVLAELAFVDNQIEGKKLSSPEWRQRAAEAIYAGILDYYEWKGNDVSKYR
ncbi:N-acetylmuramoyl-L-alanine amidase [Bacillus bombysepticus]